MSELKVGAAVRHNETATRWLFAVVHRAVGAEVEIEYADGARHTVPAERVEHLLSHLRARKRVLSLTREDLCYALYGKHFARLRPERADQMRLFLRRLGLRYQPEEWHADARIQIRPDESRVAPAISAADRAFDALLPKWLEPLRLPAGSRVIRSAFKTLRNGLPTSFCRA